MERDKFVFDRAAFRAARLRRLLTVAEVGQAANLARGTIFAVAAGRPVTLKTARAVAAALRVGLRSLLAAPAERELVGAEGGAAVRAVG
ncbi:MAG: hypothetical protein AB1716_15710 [Planctomycetota bacterium]